MTISEQTKIRAYEVPPRWFCGLMAVLFFAFGYSFSSVPADKDTWKQVTGRVCAVTRRYKSCEIKIQYQVANANYDGRFITPVTEFPPTEGGQIKLRISPSSPSNWIREPGLGNGSWMLWLIGTIFLLILVRPATARSSNA